MFKALAACPAAVVIRSDMAKYREVGRAVRAELRRLTPLVEPVSIDEAFLDLTGTEKLYGAVPAQLLATLAQQVETTLKITLSIGLSDSKFLAKVASDLDKPRGFAVLSRGYATAFFANRPVSLLWAVGAALRRRLAAEGITLVGQLAAIGERELRRAMAGSGRDSPTSLGVSTTAPSWLMPRLARSRRKPPWRRMKSIRRS
jgi:DNA polymerase IV